jgi:NAD(P)H-flavin reductase
VLLTLPIREVMPATPRAQILRIDLGNERFPYEPGQALLIASHDYQPRRPYSIASAPEDAVRNGWLELLIGVSDEGRPGPHLVLERSALVDVEGPFGRFVLPANTPVERFLFIAGGTGIAPIRAMMHRALLTPAHRIGVLYSARTPAEFAYELELRALALDGRIELRQTVTRESGDGWPGPRRRIAAADLACLLHDPRTMCFVCGPPALVEEVRRLLAGLGVPPELIRTEEFGK